MQAAHPTPEQREAAQAVAAGLCAILASLAAVIARAFLRDPRHVALIVPLCGYISRTARRFQSLVARLAAGTAHPRRPGPSRAARSGANPPRLRLPSRHAWLVATLRHEAVNHASQLKLLLSQPEAAQLLAQSTQAARLLRPLCHLLGIAPPGIPALPRKRPAKPAPPALPAPHREPVQALHPICQASRDEPATPSPSRTLAPPPCPRSRWPWFPSRSTSLA